MVCYYGYNRTTEDIDKRRQALSSCKTTDPCVRHVAWLSVVVSGRCRHAHILSIKRAYVTQSAISGSVH
jgi:hypothetical protein